MSPSNDQTPTQPDTTPLTADVVNNIPMHVAATATPVAKPADELDQIMQAVGNELKKDDKLPPKRHLFGNHKKHSASREPVNQVHPVQTAPSAPSTHRQQPEPKAAAKPKVKAGNSAPVFIIITTMAVTTVLIAAAFAAYR